MLYDLQFVSYDAFCTVHERIDQTNMPVNS